MKLFRLLKFAKMLKIDSENGLILVKDMNVFIVPVNMASALGEGLAMVVGKSSQTTLYHPGKEMGNSFFDFFVRIYGRDLIKSEDKFKKVLEDFFSLGGFGRIEFMETDFKNGKFLLRGWRLPEVISITSEEPVCHLVRGGFD